MTTPPTYQVRCKEEVEDYPTLSEAQAIAATYDADDTSECGPHTVFEIRSVAVRVPDDPAPERDRGPIVDRKRDTDVDHEFGELRTTGLLWLINRVVFHPRGYALALMFEDDGSASSWTMLGDGTEVWNMGTLDEDGPFETVEAFFNNLRP